MFLYLFGSFVKTIFNPLVDDTKIAIDKERHQVRKVFIPGFPARHQQFASTHDDLNQSIVVKQGEQPPVFIDEADERKALVFLRILLVQIGIAAPLVIDLEYQQLLFAVLAVKVPVEGCPPYPCQFTNRIHIDAVVVLGGHQFDQRIRQTQLHKSSLVSFH